jgi:hypothetical protein
MGKKGGGGEGGVRMVEERKLNLTEVIQTNDTCNYHQNVS